MCSVWFRLLVAIALRWALINPLRYLAIIVRGVTVKDMPFSVLWPNLAALVASHPPVLRQRLAFFGSSARSPV